MVVDEAQLDVERDVLGEVPARVVGLGAEHRAGLVDPLEHPDHDLLVELRGLRQVRRTAEVVHGEHVRPGLGRPGDQLRGVDLGEAAVVEDPAEPAHRGGGDPPERLAGAVAPDDRRVVEHRGQPDVEGRSPQLHGWGGRGRAQRRHLRTRELHTAGRLLARGHRALDRDHGLLRQGVEDGAVAQHDLRHTAAVAHEQERHRAQPSAAVHPALEQHPLPDPVGQLADQCSQHRQPTSSVRNPGRCGRSGARGATTPSPTARVGLLTSWAARRSSVSSTPLHKGYAAAATGFRPCATGRSRRRRRGRRAAGGARRPGPRP